MNAIVTVVVPSLNQGIYLERALASIFDQEVPVEVFVMDGGSKDLSITVLRKWEKHLAGWRSRPDGGQSAAINEGIKTGTAPFVCWLNSDDWFLNNGLKVLLDHISIKSDLPAVYGRSWNFVDHSKRQYPVWVEPFSIHRLSQRCIISQPATLIRRTAWEAVGGLNEKLKMAMDYDLWWRLYHTFGALDFVDHYIAVNRIHSGTKTNRFRRQHYREAIEVVRRHNKKVPMRWWLMQPYSVWFKSLLRS